VISKNIKRIRENKQANADLIRKEKERIEKEIRDLRETMNSYLDKEHNKDSRVTYKTFDISHRVPHKTPSFLK
jgi:flagellar motility protein MotE (MotC chaperone)